MVFIPAGTYKFKNDATPIEGQEIMLPIVATVVPFELNSDSYNGTVTTDVFDLIAGINIKYSDTVRYVFLAYGKPDETQINVYINNESVVTVDAVLPIYIESETDVPWDTGCIHDGNFVRFSSIVGSSVEGFGQTIRVLEDAEIEDDVSGNWFLDSTLRIPDVVYPNADTVIAKLQRIIDDTNIVTNKNDTTIADAVASLTEKYGKAEEWDPTAPNSVIITGTPVENNEPLAYQLTSVDELPADAVDGSLAFVGEDTLYVRENGEWVKQEIGSGSGGGSEGNGEMTGIGADIYVVMEGQCMTLAELLCTMLGSDTPLSFEAIIKTFVREELPPINRGADNMGDGEIILGVTSADGEVLGWQATYDLDTCKWSPFAGDLDLPCRGWIEKSELEALDYNDTNNAGIYAVQKITYPMYDGTLTDLVTDQKEIHNLFEGYYGLTTVTLPNAKVIGRDAFAWCYSLVDITIPQVVAINHRAFRHCALTNIILPKSLLYIGHWAFSGCSSLSSITYEGTVEQWNAIYKTDGWNDDVPATYVQCSDGTVTL